MRITGQTVFDLKTLSHPCSPKSAISAEYSVAAQSLPIHSVCFFQGDVGWGAVYGYFFLSCAFQVHGPSVISKLNARVWLHFPRRTGTGGVAPGNSRCHPGSPGDVASVGIVDRPGNDQSHPGRHGMVCLTRRLVTGHSSARTTHSAPDTKGAPQRLPRKNVFAGGPGHSTELSPN